MLTWHTYVSLLVEWNKELLLTNQRSKVGDERAKKQILNISETVSPFRICYEINLSSLLHPISRMFLTPPPPPTPTTTKQEILQVSLLKVTKYKTNSCLIDHAPVENSDLKRVWIRTQNNGCAKLMFSNYQKPSCALCFGRTRALSDVIILLGFKTKSSLVVNTQPIEKLSNITLPLKLWPHW